MKSKMMGQVFTPEWLVDEVLEAVGFTVDRLDFYHLKTVEPSFGDAAFLKPIISTMAAFLFDEGHTPDEVGAIIDLKVHGFELDEPLFHQTVKELQGFLKDSYGVEADFPNLVCGDALDCDFTDFDYVIGNPPFIRIKNVEDSYREKIKSFTHSSGTSDMYVVFFEKFMNLLADGGKLAFVTPNSWMRNVSQRSFRKDIVGSGMLESVKDFGEQKVFGTVGTYIAITVLSRSSKGAVRFQHPTGEALVSYEELDALNGAMLAFVGNNFVKASVTPLRSLCRTVNRVCTLGDKLFLITDDEILDNNLETALIRPAVKGSKYRDDPAAFEKMFFPYVENDKGKFVGVTDEDFRNDHPNLYSFMSARRSALESRSIEKGGLWFWYGRSQAIQSIDKAKLLLSTVVKPDNSPVETFLIPGGVVVYTGLFMTPEDSLVPVEKLKEILGSTEFYEYARGAGGDWSGGYKLITSRIVNEFDVTDMVDPSVFDQETTLLGDPGTLFAQFG